MKERIRSKILILLDIILVNLSILLAYVLRFDGQLKNIYPEYYKNILYFAIIASLVKLVCYWLFKLYSSLWRYAGIYEMLSIAGAALVSNAVVLSCIFLTRPSIPRSIFVITFFTDIMLVGGLRFSYRILRKAIRDGMVNVSSAKRIMVIGGGEAGALVLKQLRQHPELKSSPIAIIDDDKSKIGRKINGVPILGDRSKIIETARSRKINNIQNELLHKHPGLNLITIIANIRDKHRLDSIFRKYKPDVVFHAAAHKHVPLMELNPSEAIKNNVIGTLNVADCADKHKVKRFVLISTDKAVNPTNIMGATKRIAEMIIQAINKHSSTEFAAVRFGNVLGSNGSVIPLFKKQIEQGGPVTVTHTEVTRFFMTIPEAAQLVIQAGAMAKGGEIFVLDMGQPVKIYDLARKLIKLSGYEPDVDIKIEITGLRPGEKLYEELLLDEEGLQKTKNNKVYMAKPVFTDLAMLKREITVLNEIIINNADGVMNYVKNIVPTYKAAQY